MGIKNIYERFIWFDSQVRAKGYPNTTALANRFEISTKEIRKKRKMKTFGFHRGIMIESELRKDEHSREATRTRRKTES
jgi:hypothetical protein